MDYWSIFILFGLYSAVSGVIRDSQEGQNAGGEDGSRRVPGRHLIAVQVPHEDNHRPGADNIGFAAQRDPSNYQRAMQTALETAIFGYGAGALLDKAIAVSTGTVTDMGKNTLAVIGITYDLIKSIVLQIMERRARNPPGDGEVVRDVMQILRSRNGQLPPNVEQVVRQCVQQIREADRNDHQAGH